jgi:oligosaccharide reducing-end xylanase
MMKRNPTPIFNSKPIALLILSLFCFGMNIVVGQKQNNGAKSTTKGSYYTDVYPNLFKEAGYSQSDIDKKVAKAYHDVFEGPNRVYFEVGDSMGYVSDVKNHDARTEGLSYGLMV